MSGRWKMGRAAKSPGARAAVFLMLGFLGCDGTLTGMGRVPRPPETPLPPAPVETVAHGDGGAAPAAKAEQIAAQHLLVMYDGSKAAPKSVKRTREEARARAFEALERIKSGQEFEQVVAAYTDEPGGAARRGELGRFSRDQMVKPFSDAAFALEVGQVSTVVETPFGFHVIRRTE
jgi:NIMA-interacting peptidyl-prolyl cis-trans isomerase 1